MGSKSLLATAILGAGAALAVGAGSAHAVTLVFGGGNAEACSLAALAGKSDAASQSLCDSALQNEPLNSYDRAATLVNRGVMKLIRAEYPAARADFDASIALKPNVGEGWVNRGAAFVGERRYRAALDDLNTGLRLGCNEPEKAYFDRALAFEGLNDEKSAYLDYQQALLLKPDWDAPKVELLRFTVTRR